jgi:pantetheine-phosphate adenylyltransferase
MIEPITAPKIIRAFFMGFLRPDGSHGTHQSDVQLCSRHRTESLVFPARDGQKLCAAISTRYHDPTQLSGNKRLKQFQPMSLAMYPGSFDPVTKGHLDVIQRAVTLFDDLIVAVALNDQKHTTTLFEIEERILLLEEACAHLPSVRVMKLDGLLVDFAKREKVLAIVRGLRAISDFEFEFQMALMNRKMEPTLETIFMMPKEEYTYLSSRIVKEIARLGGDVQAFVPKCVLRALAKKFPI